MVEAHEWFSLNKIVSYLCISRIWFGSGNNQPTGNSKLGSLDRQMKGCLGSIVGGIKQAGMGCGADKCQGDLGEAMDNCCVEISGKIIIILKFYILYKFIYFYSSLLNNCTITVVNYSHSPRSHSRVAKRVNPRYFQISYNGVLLIFEY